MELAGNVGRIAAAWALVLGLAAGGLCGGEAKPVFRFGVLLPLEGELDIYGKPCLVGIQLAIKHLNATDLPYTLEAVVADTGDEAEGNTKAMERFADQGLAAVIGTVTSGHSFAVREIAERRHVVFIPPVSTHQDLTVGTSWVFRAIFVDSEQAQTAATFMREHLKLARVAVVYEEHKAKTYSTNLARLFREAFEAAGGTVVAAEAQPEAGDQAGYRALFDRLAAAGAEMVYATMYAEEAAELVREAGRAKFAPRFFGGEAWSTSMMYLAAGRNIEGCYFTSLFDFADADPAMQNFLDEVHRDGVEDGLMHVAAGMRGAHRVPLFPDPIRVDEDFATHVPVYVFRVIGDNRHGYQVQRIDNRPDAP